MIVTIDGPAGAGKSSAARQLADELGFRFLDTGAMYRAVTWGILELGIPCQDRDRVAKAAASMEIRLSGSNVYVDGQDVTQAIRAARINEHISSIADNVSVRDLLVRQQRAIAATGDYVCEGRDQGTVVFPHAECKIFLTASPQARARRRVAELEGSGMSANYATILKQQEERDRRDAARPVGGLKKADDAIEVLTDDMTFEEVVAHLKMLVQSVMQNHQA